MTAEYNLYGIAYGCPVLHRKGDCPLKDVDQLTFKGKVKWIESLSKEDKNKILEHHKACTKIR